MAFSDYDWSREQFSLANDFTPATGLQVGPDEFKTVERYDVEEGEAALVGRGDSTAPLSAEASISGNIQDGGNADIDGNYRIVVENSQNNVVTQLVRGTINEVEATRSNARDGDLIDRTPPFVEEPYQLALQLKTESGTATYSSANSSLTIDGWRGEKFG